MDRDSSYLWHLKQADRCAAEPCFTIAKTFACLQDLQRGRGISMQCNASVPVRTALILMQLPESNQSHHLVDIP